MVYPYWVEIESDSFNTMWWFLIDLKFSRVCSTAYAGSLMSWNWAGFVQCHVVVLYWFKIQPGSFNSIWWILIELKFSRICSTPCGGSILIWNLAGLFNSICLIHIDLKFSRIRTTPRWILDGQLETRCITNRAISWKLRQDKMFRSHWQRKFLLLF